MFTFDFDSLASNIVGDVTFFINASGDFSSNFSTENLFVSFSDYAGSLKLDESGLKTGLTGFTLESFSSYNVVDNYDETFAAVFTLDQAVVELLQGSSFTITTVNDSSVDAYFAENYSGTDRDFVEVGFTYAADIPEPTTLAIFALGLLGLTARRMTK